jgi:hypothetical protein
VPAFDARDLNDWVLDLDLVDAASAFFGMVCLCEGNRGSRMVCSRLPGCPWSA